MGNALFRINKLDESIVAYKKALELNPSDMDAKFNLEFAREQIKKKKEQQDESKKKKQGKYSIKQGKT
jgi:Ca-activated chloride channel family protein